VAADVSAVVDGDNHFAFELYQQLRGEKGNVFFSPASISLALAMTYAGAAGDTETEMSKTLHFDVPKGQLHDGMSAIQASWRTTDKKQGYRLDYAPLRAAKSGYLGRIFKVRLLQVSWICRSNSFKAPARMRRSVGSAGDRREQNFSTITQVQAVSSGWPGNARTRTDAASRAASCISSHSGMKISKIPLTSPT
jgi:hypothetical protein